MMNQYRNETPWVVAEFDGAGQVGRCTRCGEVLRLKCPMRLTAVCLYMEGFCAEHSCCQEPQP
jgi:hypothetical protein